MTAPTTTSNVTPLKTNLPDFSFYRDIAKTLGQQAGLGKDTQIKFALELIKGGYQHVLSTEPDKHGAGRSDAVVLSEEYVRATQGAVIFDVKANKTKKQVSNSKKFIEFGSSPRYGNANLVDWVDAFLNFRQKIRAKDPLTLKKAPNGKTDKDLDDANNGLLRLLTAQKKLSSLMPDDERNAFAFKTDKEEATEADYLEKARKALIMSSDASPEVKIAKDAITKRLANIAKGQK